MNYLEEARKVFDTEIEALEKMKNNLGSNFEKILRSISECKGKVIITGMGKPGHIARKIAATMSSLGTPSFFLHPAEALHGDLGMIREDDIIIAISYSGESEELTRLLSNIKVIGSKLIGITGNSDSTLIKYCDMYEVFPKFDEACNLGLAPTSSTTVTLVYGDALAVVASKIYGFNESNFGLFHPAGSIGKKLFIKVKDLMASGKNNAYVKSGVKFKNALVEMSQKGLGIINVIDNNNHILGVMTDGDLRRKLELGADIYNLTIDDIMTKTPLTVFEDELAIESLKYLNKNNISSAPVINSKLELVGTIRLRDILNKGIVL